jgi:hypothetical protein
MQADYVELDATLRNILRVNLEARLVLCEIRRASAIFELGSRFITPKKQAELVKMRDAAIIEWGVVMTELEALSVASKDDSVHSPSPRLKS